MCVMTCVMVMLMVDGNVGGNVGGDVVVMTCCVMKRVGKCQA